MNEQTTWAVSAPPSVEFLRFAFGRLGDGVFWLDATGRVVYANETACRSLERSYEELLACRVPDFDPNFNEERWQAHWERVKALDSFTLETLHRSKSGRIFPVEVTVNYFSHGGNEFHCAIVRDISARKRLEESMEMAAAIYRSSSEAIMVTDENNRIIDVNPAFTHITGYSLEELRGKSPAVLRSNLHDSTFYREMWNDIGGQGHWQGELWDRRKNGELFASYGTISLIRNHDGGTIRYVAQFSEITEKKRKDELIWQRANYDFLTGLPNRYLFYDRLGQEIKKAHRAQHPLALLFIDLDEFKQINDCHGHDKGDLLLTESARRIGKCVRETDTVARLGGDEFTVILPGLVGCVDIGRIAADIIGELAAPYTLGNTTGMVSASVGVALYPADAQGVPSLLKCADQAMYEAKKKGGNRFSFTPGSGCGDVRS